MSQRTCTFCDASIDHRPNRAIYCSKSCGKKAAHKRDPDARKRDQARYRASAKGRAAKRQYIYTRTCVMCGTEWRTERRVARFCSDKCKGQHYSDTRSTRCQLPPDHPVRVEMARQREASRKPKPEPFTWRTERQCPGCACWFTPLYTPSAVTCSKRCGRRVHRWRRKAAERDAVGEFTWIDFMRIAGKFKFCCAYCSEKPDGQLEPDHVVPLSKGGMNTASNLLPACHLCNADKNAHLLPDWNVDRARRGLEPRTTTWSENDKRYTHLAVLSVAPAAA